MFNTTADILPFNILLLNGITEKNKINIFLPDTKYGYPNPGIINNLPSQYAHACHTHLNQVLWNECVRTTKGLVNIWLLCAARGNALSHRWGSCATDSSRHDNELNTALRLYVLAVFVCPCLRTKTMLPEALQLFNVCELIANRLSILTSRDVT